jgi:hypothetical protein
MARVTLRVADKPTAASVQNMLKVLGSDSKTVALRLQSLEIKGKVGASGTCPLANYLNEVFPNRDGFFRVNDNVLCGNVVITNPLRFFVVDFDAHKFPELIG